jgi:cytochrome c peroxidase
LLNVGYESRLFWDGRVLSLEEQARMPLLNPAEHGLRDGNAVVQVVRGDSTYVADFRHAMPARAQELSLDNIASALAAFERTLVAGDSAFDRYQYGGDKKALSATAVRGLALFRGRGQCVACHQIGESSALFTDQLFHTSPIGLPTAVSERLGGLTARVADLRKRGAVSELNALITTDSEIAALGRFTVTLEPKDIGCFKTPSLRNIALTGPYMHDGSVASLPQAIELELYSRADQRYPLVLTQDEQRDLLEFMNSLTSFAKPQH